MLIKHPGTLPSNSPIQPPQVGSIILYRGLGEAICEGVVTQIKRIPTRQGQRWGAFLDTAAGPVFINDWRCLCTK